ncbi:MAG: ABC transporter, substrate-binding protein (cluster 4, leucine/isoleucine/valine/benzoate) [uncultured Craurococcus sp.]|uniref:ABC transporter, substrate-binding protein (Cluster 4, leucine/isoleucine/valine/benzoate) n=1 Tax=uncultured Craurococcus sp. TaxID=1135998 RepID=A0A6J4H2W2_9PROT|nr:MAG: ABC transporter, substrate-binding protein (cluster 4, leucine/isoleucine/valine/benzoate) [uncultured Craurococcus sp.]
MTAFRTTRRSLLGAGAALTIPATVARAQGPARGGDPLRVGVMTDLSGPFAGAGSLPLFWGAEVAIELFNERGGVDGRPVQAVTADSQSKADVAINEMERLLGQERLEVVTGIYSSAHAVPLSGRFEQSRKMMWITSAIATAVLKDKNFRYVFRPTVHSDQYGEGSISAIAENAQAKLGLAPDKVKLGVIYEDGPYGTGVASAIEANAKSRNMPIVLKEAYSSTAPDLSTLVTKLRRERPDIVLQVGYNPDITLFLRQAKSGGLRFKMLIGHGAGWSQIDRLTETFGGDVNHMCNVDPAATQMLDWGKLQPGIGDLAKTFMDRFQAKHKLSDPPTHASMGFNNTWIFLEHVLKPAVRKSGGMSADALREAALAVDVPEGGTIQGYGVKFAPPGDPMAGQNQRSLAVVMQFENGKSKVVWPASLGQPIVMPLPASNAYAAR